MDDRPSAPSKQSTGLHSTAAKPDYGIDAPQIRLAMSVVGGVGMIGAVAIAAFAPGRWSWAAAPAAVAGVYGIFMASYMTWGSRVGKLRTRERLLDRVAEIKPWSAVEAVLDVGCGRGLMLIGAARRLARGKATGIDLWSQADQGGNSAENARANARLEGVANRISIHTGDARRLPYPDASVDIALSHWVLHNIEAAAGRLTALDEIRRVLRPGGVLALADIQHVSQYADHLAATGWVLRHVNHGGVEAVVMGALSGGTYRPQSLVATRADADVA